MSTETFSTFFALLTAAANVFVLGAIGLWLAAGWSATGESLRSRLAGAIRPSAIGFAWVAAVVATAGSLYYSEVAHFVPCRLCWYQRIAMYPMVLLLGIAWLRRDTAIRRYAFPLSIAGGLISIYHYQLQRFPGQGTLSCEVEAPCSLTWVWTFHYISIPFMALSAFALIATLMLMLPRHEPERLEETIGHDDDAKDRPKAFATEGTR